MGFLILIVSLLMVFLAGCYCIVRAIRSGAGMRTIAANFGVLIVSASAATCAILHQVGYVGENFRAVSENECYRSAQLSPAALQRHVHESGIKTVINLRGESKSAWHQDESSMLQSMNVSMVSIGLDTERLPQPERLARLIDCLQTAPRPLLLHCNHGVDRTGIAAVLFKRIVKDEPLETAIAAENSILTGHIATAQNNAGERFFDLYRNSGTVLSLEAWSRTEYPRIHADLLSKGNPTQPSWLNSPVRLGSLVLTPFKALGILGASLFACRWFVQAYYSRRAGRPVTPLNFWLISIAGSALMLVYFTFSPKQDIVGIISNLFPAAVAAYNVSLELRFRARERLANEAQRAIANDSTSAGLSSQVHAA